ncbi:MAG TPA: ATP-binding protein [Candidatus Hydrogenedentes bacterium]|nr:ATP-binding protein [Candidatus Hydrogenedentota bacterium]HPG68615.1 ATP-binding protein [Candidatus Hydrogenedentota bacterium]
MANEDIRILVVDDELGMREGCRKILTAEGYQVSTAADGAEGFEIFQRERNFAVALVDLKMPRIGGIELIHRIRELDDTIIMFVITAHAAIDTAVEATRRGAYGYIPKPFTPDELLLPLRNGLERRALAIEAQRLRREREGRLFELAFERSKSSTIISCMTDGVLVINRDKQIVLRNAALTRIMPSFAVLPLSSPIEEIQCREIIDLFEDAFSDGTTPVIASKEVALAGKTYLANASPVLEPDGKVMGAVLVLRDISELKKLETAKSMFISMVAHEVKSPLAAIESQLTMVLNGFLDNDPEKKTGAIERALLRATGLRTLVSDLLNLTAMETGHFEIKRVPLAIRSVIDEVIAANRERAEDGSVEITMSCAEDMDGVQVLADKDSMFMVFSNLLNNAIKYSPPPGHVEVVVEHDRTHVHVTVKDSGIGIAKEDQENIFDEFFRVKSAHTQRITGTGLGLTIVKRLVDMHDGAITVESALGEGSAFTVSLPITR